MNSIHDMGGMDGFGPIEHEENEPVFHEPWEGRVYALMQSLGRWGRGRDWKGFRWELESIPPDEYLAMSYYERWLRLLRNRLVGSDLLTEEEFETGYAEPERPLPEVLQATPSGSLGSGLLDLDVPSRFQASDAVRGRNVHPRGHTRLPRYVRGRRGTVVEDHGVYAIQDSDENGRQRFDRPQHVYSVRFDGTELWGGRASTRDAVYVDMWEDYLEPAS